MSARKKSRSVRATIDAMHEADTKVDRARTLKLSESAPPDRGSGSQEAETLRGELAAATGYYAARCRDAVEEHIARVLRSNGTT